VTAKQPGAITRTADAVAPYGLVIITICVLVLFSALLPQTYFSVLNFEVIAANQAPTLILALAILLPLITGEFDLSVAANFGFCELLVCGLIINQHIAWGLAVVITVAVGAVIGVVNGILVVGFRVNSFIATLAMTTVLAGMTTWYSGGQIISGNFPSAFLNMGQANVFGSLSIFVVYALAIALVVWIGLTYLPSGRHMYATGGGRHAAELLGLRTKRLIIVAFILCGMIAAFAGVVDASQLSSGQPEIGADYLLPAYAGAFLGSTTISLGQFNVWGTVIGVYLLGAGVAGLQELGMGSYTQDFFDGGALAIAVAASAYVARRRASGSVGRDELGVAGTAELPTKVATTGAAGVGPAT
jgi:ribose transport system permease protein